VEADKFDAALPQVPPEAANTQAPAAFVAEAQAIVAATHTLTWRAPSRHEGEGGRGAAVLSEGDEGAGRAGDSLGQAAADTTTAGRRKDAVDQRAASPEVAAGDLPRGEGHELAWGDTDGLSSAPDWDGADLVRTPIRGGTVRGRVIHKLIEEILTGELADAEAAVIARAGDLLDQLGEAAADDPTLGYSPAELAAASLRGLALPEVAALRPRLVPELPVYGHATDPDEPRAAIATAGIADAVALDATGRIDCVIDWKSDQAPTKAQRDDYRRQLQDYLRLTGASEGMLVYVTLGRVERVAGRSEA
jgi:exodeoxyribonuclease-5